MTKQGIRDLKKDLDDSLKSLAEVKATAIRSKREANNHKETSEDYKKKAKALLQMGAGKTLIDVIQRNSIVPYREYDIANATKEIKNRTK